MRFLLSLFISFLCLCTINAQYTELLNSRRPGFSDSPFSVGTDVLQFEGGLFYRSIDDTFNNTKVSSLGSDLMVRYGKYWEKLEVNLNVKFQHDNIDFGDIPVDQNPLPDDVNGFAFSQLTIGAKYLVYSPKYQDKSKEIRSWKRRTSFDWKRLIPAVGVYAGVNLPITKNYVGGNFPRYQKDEFSPKIALYTQNNFTDKFVFVSNLIMDRIGSGEKENSYILTATYSITDKWSIFGEHQGIFKDEDIPNDFQFGGGVAYLFNKNTQFDIAARAISDRDGSALLLNAGMAWRLDRHKDKFKIIGADGQEVENGEKKGGFFSRLFGKKDRFGKQRKVKQIKAKKRKIKKDKPAKKTKAQKRREKDAKKEAKQTAKDQKKKQRDYNKNYDPDQENDNSE